MQCSTIKLLNHKFLHIPLLMKLSKWMITQLEQVLYIKIFSLTINSCLCISFSSAWVMWTQEKLLPPEDWALDQLDSARTTWLTWQTMTSKVGRFDRLEIIYKKKLQVKSTNTMTRVLKRAMIDHCLNWRLNGRMRRSAKSIQRFDK